MESEFQKIYTKKQILNKKIIFLSLILFTNQSLKKYRMTPFIHLTHFSRACEEILNKIGLRLLKTLLQRKKRKLKKLNPRATN